MEGECEPADYFDVVTHPTRGGQCCCAVRCCCQTGRQQARELPSCVLAAAPERGRPLARENPQGFARTGALGGELSWAREQPPAKDTLHSTTSDGHSTS